MKKQYVFLVFLIISFSIFSQDIDSTTIKLGESNVTIAVEKSEKKDKNKYYRSEKMLGDHVYAHWSGLDVGVSMLLNSSGGTTFSNMDFLEIDPAASWTFNVNLFEHFFPIARHNFGFVTGIGFNASHFGFKRNYVLHFDYLNDTVNVSQDTLWNYSRNRLLVGYAQLPLLFQINTSDKLTKNVHIAFGLLAGVRLGSDLKRKASTSGERYRYVERGSFFLNPFKLDATIRLGYRNWGMFASYNLVPIFDTRIVEQANSISFGLCFTW